MTIDVLPKESYGIPRELVQRASAGLYTGDIKPRHVGDFLRESMNGDYTGHPEDREKSIALMSMLLQRKDLETRYGGDLSVFEPREYSEPTIENPIGSIGVMDIGYAGPAKVKGEYAKGEYPVILGTNEAGLVASTSKALKLAGEIGGVETSVMYSHMTRAPLLETDSIRLARDITKILNNDPQVRKYISDIVEKTANVTRVQDVRANQHHRNVHVKIKYDTGDAMGMNSATIYSGRIIKGLLSGEYLGLELPETYKELFDKDRVKLRTLSSNACSDKKVSQAHISDGRGTGVVAEMVIPLEHLIKFYGGKVDPQDIISLYHGKNIGGGEIAGMVGSNANVANLIAALFVTTAQDAGQIPESSIGLTNAYIKNDNFIWSLQLPSLEVGTYGGGTAKAKGYLEMLNCYGPGEDEKVGHNKMRLAEIIAATAAAQDLHLLAVQANGLELAESHDRLTKTRVRKEQS